MADFLPFIVTGLVTGTIYGLAGTGLVLTFKTSGIFNFGHGAILTAAALIFYWMRVTLEWDWKIAAFLAVMIAGPLFGLVMESVARNLSRQPTTMKIVGTVALMVTVPAICLLFYPASNNGLRVDRFLPLGDRKQYKWRILDVNVFGDQVVTAVVALAAVAALYALFRHTRLGASMRAAVDDPDLLDLLGTSPVRVRRIAWMIGATFAALSGVLILPLVGLQPYSLVFLATYAFGAAAIGGFTSIPITFAGGLLVGIAQDIVGFQVNKQQWTTLSGLSDALPFLLLFIVLLLIPKHKLTPRSDAEARPPLQWSGAPALRAGVGAVVLAVLVLVPSVVGTKLPFYTFGLCSAILMLSLGLLIKTSGQVSLCHATFAGIGALAFSRFTIEARIPWVVALVLAGLVAVPVGAIVALPAIRLHGVYLALATFGFGILVTRLFFPQDWMFFTFAGGRKVPSPFGSTSQTTRYYVILAVLVVTSLVIVVISQSRLGRMLRGMSGSPTAISTLGLSTNVTKIIVFCISAFIAAIGGAMYGVALTNVDGSTAVFQPFYSLVLVAILALAPFREPWYAVFAGMTAVIPGYIGGNRTPQVLNLLFGIFAIMVALQGGHPSMPPRLQAVFERFGRRSPVEPTVGSRAALAHRPDPGQPDPGQPGPGQPDPGVPGLELAGLVVRFGGLRAVDGVSFTAPVGRITGLIGPNGAGKTTTFNAVSGINRNISGRLTFRGQDITRLGTAARGRLGIGRTFQRMEMADSLTVAENVALGSESSLAGARLVRQLFAPRAEWHTTQQATREAMAMCGISHLAGSQAGELSTGERRLVELARCLAGRFDLLLLDEPSSGLDRDETARFGEVLRTVVEQRGCGILLVEHDMSMVMNVCSYIYVLDFGRMLFEGEPAAVAASTIVRDAYLGSEELETATVAP